MAANLSRSSGRIGNFALSMLAGAAKNRAVGFLHNMLLVVQFPYLATKCNKDYNMPNSYIARCTLYFLLAGSTI